MGGTSDRVFGNSGAGEKAARHEVVTVAPGGNDQTKWVELGYFQEIRNEASHRLLVGKFDIYVLEVSESHQG